MAFAYFQNRKSLADHQALTRKIADEILAAKMELAGEMQKDLKAEKEKFEQRVSDIQQEMETKMKKDLAGVSAKTHSHIAVTLCESKNFRLALHHCKDAIEYFVEANNESTMQRAVGVVIETVLPNLEKTDFDGNEELNSSIEKIIQSIESINENGRYDKPIQDIRKAHKAALAR
ncbi:MAG: hypothetical protein R8K20_01290 [Gallionellaceae bacterium]